MSKAKPYKPQKQSNIQPKGVLLYAFLIPLFLSVILALFQMAIMTFIVNSIAFTLFFISAKLSTKGFGQEREYLLATLTKAPKIPYKTMSALVLGGATFFTFWIAGDKSLIIALFSGLISIIGYYLYYGFDPKEDKLENLGDISAEFVLETLSEAKAKIASIYKNLEKIKDKNLEQKIRLASKKAEHILGVIQEDPKDIRVARKFLLVYIDGVEKVVDSYVSLDEKEIDQERKERMLDLMDELDRTFDKELERLKNNNLFDLDVHIDVLKEQMK